MNCVYSSKGHRIGDKIVLEACFRDFKNDYPRSNLIFMDDKREVYSSSQLELDIMFRHCVDKYIAVHKNEEFKVSQGDTGFTFGNLWQVLPRLRANKIFPKIDIPYDWTKWYDRNPRFKNLESPIICIHALSNPSYNQTRRHSPIDFRKIIVYLAKQGFSVIKIGIDNGSIIRYNNVVDVSLEGFSVMASAAIIGHCNLFIGGDTGMTHIAAALGKRIIAVYGPNTHDKKAFGDDWDSFPNTADNNITVFIMKNNFIEGTLVANEAVRFLDTGIGKGYASIDW